MRSCTYCTSKVEWLLTKFSTNRIPFDARPVPVDDLPDGVQGWIPGQWETKNKWGRTVQAILMAPLEHYSRRKQQAVVAVFTVHTCARYKAAQQAAGKQTADVGASG